MYSSIGDSMRDFTLDLQYMCDYLGFTITSINKLKYDLMFTVIFDLPEGWYIQFSEGEKSIYSLQKLRNDYWQLRTNLLDVFVWN